VFFGRVVVRWARSGYRKALLKGLSEGDVGWISEVLEFVDKSSEAPWVREKRLKREQGEKLSANLQAAGFSNIFDYLEHPEEMR
jgi:hypothetical protein